MRLVASSDCFIMAFDYSSLAARGLRTYQVGYYSIMFIVVIAVNHSEEYFAVELAPAINSGCSY